MTRKVVEGFMFDPVVTMEETLDREGTVCQIIGRQEGNNTLETGPAFMVEFSDGFQMEAYSDELKPWYPT
jgi:hypothetical protein